MGLGFHDGFAPNSDIQCQLDLKADIVGTCKVGEMRTTKANLIKTFGKPFEFANDYDDKVTCQWILKFTMPDGESVLATIYDYKEPSKPTLHRDIWWSIGGHNSDAEFALNSYIEGKKL